MTALPPLEDRPGFLIRRLHQIHAAMFQEECAAFGITPVQYSLMTLLQEHPGLDQGAAALGLGLDRFATADVANRLRAAGLLRSEPGRDRRTRALYLTEAGRRRYAEMAPAVARAHERMVECLPPQRRAAFLGTLKQLVAQLDPVGRGRPRLG